MRIVIAEDQVLLREGLARLFQDGGHQVVASRGDARDLVATVAGHKPDLVVLDIRMPPTFTDEGTRAAHEIKQAQPDTGVLLLSQHIETAHVVDLVGLGGSDTCSRTGSWQSPSSSTLPSASPGAALRSIPRW